MMASGALEMVTENKFCFDHKQPREIPTLVGGGGGTGHSRGGTSGR